MSKKVFLNNSKTIKVEVVAYDDLTDAEKLGSSDNGCGRQFASYMRVIQEGNTIGIYTSAMEPEDVSFHRDLDWVPELVVDIFERGRKKGRVALESTLTDHQQNLARLLGALAKKAGGELRIRDSDLSQMGSSDAMEIRGDPETGELVITLIRHGAS